MEDSNYSITIITIDGLREINIAGCMEKIFVTKTNNVVAITLIFCEPIS